MKITKVHLSKNLAPFFHQRFMKKYGLTEIEPDNLTEPMIVLGCYINDPERVIKHKGLVIIAWMGGDAAQLERNKQFNKPNIFHISQSDWITKDLRYSGLNPIELPVCCVDVDNWQPEPLGEKIYLYTSFSSPFKYGIENYNQLIRYFGKDKFIIAQYDTFEDVKEAYRETKFALRLTPHDGLSETVAELGLMGRICIHNGIIPNSIPYKDFYDIKRVMKILLNSENDVNFVAKEVKIYLDLINRADWLNTEYYETN